MSKVLTFSIPANVFPAMAAARVADTFPGGGLPQIQTIGHE